MCCVLGVADEYEEEELVDDEGDMMDVEGDGATAQVGHREGGLLIENIYIYICIVIIYLLL